MPELPEVETVRRGLLARLQGQSIRRVQVLRQDSIGYPDPDHFAKALAGHTFKDIKRRGKYLIFELDRKAYMAAHLRMSGRLLVTKGGKCNARSTHIRVKIELDSGEYLIFEDMRVFGRLWYIPGGQRPEDHVSGLAELGPEPLDGLSVAYLQEAFANKTQAIKSALLDQTIIAGIGNIYADESLFLAHINPQRPAKNVTSDELSSLSGHIRDVLLNSIKKGGSTLRNYTDSDGVNGNYQRSAFVYGREGEPCHHCGIEIERVKIGGRSSHYCPHCQPRARQGKSTTKSLAARGKPR